MPSVALLPALWHPRGGAALCMGLLASDTLWPCCVLCAVCFGFGSPPGNHAAGLGPRRTQDQEDAHMQVADPYGPSCYGSVLARAVFFTLVATFKM